MKNTDKKVVKKSTKKVVKEKKTVIEPTIIYDITMCETLEDILYVFGAVNMLAGLPVTPAMEEALVKACKKDILYLADMMFDGDILVRHNGSFVEPKIVNTVTLNKDEELKVTKKKKPNVFKRFWNWITRKK